ncbi:MBL fold metallo-hydrolase [uncultured Tateyamaria sp.]|uniref:MBL fold metallo-hydrolase n=1 Tax=uncultured Tateyamaria sp. TaxID=455651 RepID=UPI002615E69D|nr:MBL fold metallo-hydrolase [uncultured Tateyamaria sp.]
MYSITHLRRISLLFVLSVLCVARLAHADMTAQFLGNTTIVFDDGTDVILTDGFLSRPGLHNYALGIKIETDTGRVNRALDSARVTSAAAIFVAHAHFDHALDAGFVAHKLGARVFGSRSTRAVAKAFRRPAGDPALEFTLLHDERTYRVGNYTVTAIYTPHGWPNRFPGELRPGFKTPQRMRDFLANENYSFLIRNGRSSVLVVPGGNYLPGKLWPDRYRADTVFLGIGGLNSAHRREAGRGNPNFIETYWSETVDAVQATTVVPIHWDNFFRELTQGEPFRTPPRIVEDVAAVRRTLGKIVADHNARKDRKICLLWLEEPFQTIDVNGTALCPADQDVAVLPAPNK